MHVFGKRAAKNAETSIRIKANQVNSRPNLEIH
jgi:hypothetical protein